MYLHRKISVKDNKSFNETVEYSVSEVKKLVSIIKSIYHDSNQGTRIDKTRKIQYSVFQSSSCMEYKWDLHLWRHTFGTRH
mgnify:CR=1 FL=1